MIIFPNNEAVSVVCVIDVQMYNYSVILVKHQMKNANDRSLGLETEFFIQNALGKCRIPKLCKQPHPVFQKFELLSSINARKY